MKEIKLVEIPKEVPSGKIEPEEASKIIAVKIPKVDPVSQDTELPLKGLITALDIKRSSEQVLIDFLQDISDKYQDLLREIIVRFNTAPRRYEKQDFIKLLQAIIKGYSLIEELEAEVSSYKEEVESKLSELYDKITSETDKKDQELKQEFLQNINNTILLFGQKLTELKTDVYNRLNNEILPKFTQLETEYKEADAKIISQLTEGDKQIIQLLEETADNLNNEIQQQVSSLQTSVNKELQTLSDRIDALEDIGMDPTIKERLEVVENTYALILDGDSSEEASKKDLLREGEALYYPVADSGTSNYKWVRIAADLDLVNVNDRITDAEDAITDLQELVADLGDVQIKDFTELPACDESYKKVIARINGEDLYNCIEVKGTLLESDFSGLLENSEAITEDSRYIINNCLPDGIYIPNYDISTDYYEELYRYNHSICLGSSISEGCFALKTSGKPWTSLAITVKPWSTSEASSLNIWDDHNNTFDEYYDITEETTITWSTYIDSLYIGSYFDDSREVAYNDRLIITKIEVFYDDVSYEWSPLITPITNEEIDEMFNLPILNRKIKYQARGLNYVVTKANK